MANAFKCDRCGRYYDNSTNYYKYNLSKYSETGKYLSFDLCNSCKDSLEEWMDKILLRKAFRKAKQHKEQEETE